MERAVKQGANFIITHEPTFYKHFDEAAALVPWLQAIVSQLPVSFLSSFEPFRTLRLS